MFVATNNSYSIIFVATRNAGRRQITTGRLPALSFNICGRLNKIYERGFYEGAGHALLQRQNEREGANMGATQQVWPRTVAFLVNSWRKGVDVRMACRG